MILSDVFIIPVSHIQTQQVMMSLIRSHIEYLIQTLSYSCAHFVVKSDKKCSLYDRFQYDLLTIRDSGLLSGDQPVYV